LHGFLSVNLHLAEPGVERPADSRRGSTLSIVTHRAARVDHAMTSSYYAFFLPGAFFCGR
jgi:hypothetical protein